MRPSSSIVMIEYDVDVHEVRSSAPGGFGRQLWKVFTKSRAESSGGFSMKHMEAHKMDASRVALRDFRSWVFILVSSHA